MIPLTNDQVDFAKRIAKVKRRCSVCGRFVKKENCCKPAKMSFWDKLAAWTIILFILALIFSTIFMR